MRTNTAALGGVLTYPTGVERRWLDHWAAAFLEDLTPGPPEGGGGCEGGNQGKRGTAPPSSGAPQSRQPSPANGPAMWSGSVA